MARKNNPAGQANRRPAFKTGTLLTLGAGVILILCAVVFSGVLFRSDAERVYHEKSALLRDQVLTHEVEQALGEMPAGKAGYAVFLSVCDTTKRASVFTGTGRTLKQAWNAADHAAATAVKEDDLDAVWVKADVVQDYRLTDENRLSYEVLSARHEFYRYGIAFDSEFQTALLEAELNGAKIYDYEDGGLDFEYLNSYLRKSGRTQLSSLPNQFRLFTCMGWMCDADGTVYRLNREGLEYGRRDVELIDRNYVEQLISNASEFLVEQVNDDGSFIYGMYPRFDNEIDNYNILRHAGTIWSLICRYRLFPDEELVGIVDSTFDYMLTQVLYEDEETAYLYEAKADEIKLGGNSVAIIGMTEYMDVFGNEKYREVCCQLGNGILKMLDQETGQYYHVLNGDFSRKEEYRTVYYDGEATFALCRLYSLTGEQKWLDAAVSAVEHFIAADYTQHKDHWVAYSLNELTKHITDNPDYYTFALKNAQVNLEEIYQRDTTYHTYLELLMVTFELYDRMLEKGITVDYLEEFDLEFFLKTIYTRADRMLNGYFYPEYAMYMENPQRILNTFMVRHDGYRIRIDDVQHNIGGYYMYYKHYDKMVEYGLLEAIDKA